MISQDPYDPARYGAPPLTLATAALAPEDEPDAARAEAERKERILQQARERFRRAEEAEAAFRREALEDQRFMAGEQWDPAIRNARALDGRPCLTINRLPQFKRQVTNEQRQNKPAIQVNPVGDGADVETAETIQGVVRHIEILSHADAAYDTAGDAQTTGGRGFIRVVADYADPKSFDQELFIRRVANAFSVYYDPSSTEADGSDAQWCFVVEDLLPEDFRRQYPNSELASLASFESVGDGAPGWLARDAVRVAEYWYVERERRTLALLADGSTAFLEDLPPGAPVVRTRETHVPRVKWCKIDALEVLEERDWPGKWIPVVPVYGDETVVDGQRQWAGIVRYARDSQRMYNYWATAETEMIALAPRAPFIGQEGQFEGHEEQWRQANVRNFPYLEYKPTGANGQLAPPPARQPYEPPIAAISTARGQSADDMKATTGIYDASLGAQSADRSGRAILARQKEGDVANFHFIDNLARAIGQVGRILVDLIPRIYDAPRILRIVKPDGTHEMVPVNQEFRKTENSIPKLYDLTTGQYDVTVSVGPSYMSKRQEAAESMMQLVQSYPALMQIAGDLLVTNMDWPGAKEIAARLKKTLPPALQADEDGERQQQPLSPQAQAAVQQLARQHDALVQQVHALSDTIQTKRLELESRERIAAFQVQARLVETLVETDKLNSAQGIDMLRRQFALVQQRLDLLHAGEPLGAETEPAPEAGAQPIPPAGGPDAGGGSVPAIPPSA